MSGMPTVLVEMFMGGSWVDVSTGTATAALLDRAAQPLTITRGRDNEQGQTSAGVCTFSLVNDDGRFTLGNTAGPYGANFKLWTQVRVTVNGVREFSGYMSNAETSWDDDSGANAHTAVTCTDLLGMMAMSPVARSWAGALISALSPLYWWKLNDAEGSTQALEAGGGMPLVQALTAGTEAVVDHLTFGVEGPGALEADTQFSWSNTDTQAWRLQSSGTISGLGSTYTVLFLYTPADEPFASTYGGRIVSIVAGSAEIAFEVDNFGGVFANQYVSGVSDIVGAAGIQAARGVPRVIGLVVTPGNLTMFGDPGLPANRQSAPSMNGAAVSIAPIITFDPDSKGTISNLAIINRAITQAEYDSLSLKVVGGVGPVADWLNRALSEAGYGSSASATYNRAMERPALKGSNPAETGAALANSADAVFAVDKAGVPTWYDFTYCPTRIPIASGEWETGSTWAPDPALYYSEVQFDGVVAGTVAGAFPRKALDVQPLLTATDQTSLTNWYVNAQPALTGPRLSQIGIDMATVANSATYQAIDLRSRINLAAVPSQIPASGVMTVEGYTASIGATSWDLTLNTAPDPRFVWGDTIAGVWDSGYRWGPF